MGERVAPDTPRARLGVQWHLQPWLDETVALRLTLEDGRWVRMDMTPELWELMKEQGDRQMAIAQNLKKSVSA